jgi:putative acetyltransferase
MSAIYSQITKATEADLPRLFEVWESSVRATHSFLSETDLNSLVPLARAEIATFKPIYCVRNADGLPIGMLGVEGSKIEMLFIHADDRRSGAGRMLVEFAIQELRANSVDVNEQNEAAIGFYQRMGFRVKSRSPLDSLGNPFPILHMVL